MAALLWQIGGREIDGDAIVRERKPDRVQRGAHAFARFADRLVGKADDVELAARRGTRADMHLHIDLARLHALEGHRVDVGETHSRPPCRTIWAGLRRNRNGWMELKGTE